MNMKCKIFESTKHVGVVEMRRWKITLSNSYCILTCKYDMLFPLVVHDRIKKKYIPSYQA